MCFYFFFLLFPFGDWFNVSFIDFYSGILLPILTSDLPQLVSFPFTRHYERQTWSNKEKVPIWNNQIRLLFKGHDRGWLLIDHISQQHYIPCFFCTTLKIIEWMTTDEHFNSKIMSSMHFILFMTIFNTTHNLSSTLTPSIKTIYFPINIFYLLIYLFYSFLFVVVRKSSTLKIRKQQIILYLTWMQAGET